jgi:hypothetical protein
MFVCVRVDEMAGGARGMVCGRQWSGDKSLFYTLKKMRNIKQNYTVQCYLKRCHPVISIICPLFYQSSKPSMPLHVGATATYN